MTDVVIHGFFFWCRAERKCDKKTNFLRNKLKKMYNYVKI